MIAKVQRQRAMSIGVVVLAAIAIVNPLSAGVAAASNATSPVLAGYDLATSTAPASASAHFVVPAIPCPNASDGWYGTGFGIALYDSSTLVGAAVVEPDCNGLGGTAEYPGFLAVLPGKGSRVVGISAGDSISVKLTQSASKATLSLTDSTAGLAATVNVNGSQVFTDVMVGVVDLETVSGNPVPVTQFSTVRFSSVKFDGTTIAASGAQPFDMVNGNLKVSTGRLNSTGTAWTNTWVSS